MPKQAAHNSHVPISRTNALAGLPVREPFERYGGDAYFDENWHPVMIVDEGLSKLEEDSKKDCSSFLFETSNFSSLLSLSDFYDFYDLMISCFFAYSHLSLSGPCDHISWSRWLDPSQVSFPFFTLHVGDFGGSFVSRIKLKDGMQSEIRLSQCNMKQTYHILKWFY